MYHTTDTIKPGTGREQKLASTYIYAFRLKKKKKL